MARSLRAAARQLQAPVRAQMTSGLRLVGLMLALVALYAVLTNAAAFGGALGGAARALEWLRAPQPIPRSG